MKKVKGGEKKQHVDEWENHMITAKKYTNIYAFRK
jgi:hypothetical protein